MKRVVKKIFLSCGGILLIYSLLLLGVKIGYVMRDIKMRVVEVPTENIDEFVSRYWSRLGINFPEEISNVKIAKTPVIEGSINYLIKFETEQYETNLLMKALEEKCNGHLLIEDYSENVYFLKPKKHMPHWFFTPIKKGRVLTTLSSNMMPFWRFEMCVDETTDQKSVVYISCSVYK